MFSLKLPNKFSSENFKFAINNISDSKRKTIERYIYKNNRLRSLLSDLLIRYIVMNKFNLKNDDLVFCSNKYGKPFLKNSSDFHYNIFHSGKWIICTIHSQKIGVDIEKVRYLDFNILIQSFSKYEKSYFTNAGEDDISKTFFYIWTLKESYVKALGKGLYIPLNSFTIKNRFLENDISVYTNYYDNNFYFKKYHYDNYIFSVCSKVNEFPTSINEIEIEDILRHKNFNRKE
ncbi:4'-phosphopantetheinyl transferase family protein [Staphylococcus schleiferi]|uniref:4'-phosphopantetheinyl transferase family protein n=1 Tax=Staphylococcus schleiferi TaxID=1295 RepID=UPI003CCBB525